MKAGVKVTRPTACARSVRASARARGRVCLLAFAIVFSVAAASAARAQSEDQVKAAFLFNFARYVEWPDGAFPDAGSPIAICTIGAKAFGSVVSSIVSGKSVGDRPVVVVDPAKSPKTACHIVYIGGSHADPGGAVARFEGQSVFTVSDRDGFARAGGVANFFRADNKIRFEINPGVARRSGLKVSSKLLRLARVVE